MRSPARDPGFSSTMLPEPDAATVARWEERAAQVRAEPFDRQRGAELFMRLWSGDEHLAALAADELVRLAGYLQFVRVPAGQRVIAQDEQGDYLLIVLEGTLAVDRVQPWGDHVRLAEAHAGEMLGEMAMVDAGTRFSACTTVAPCTLAVVDAGALGRMVQGEPRLALHGRSIALHLLDLFQFLTDEQHVVQPVLMAMRAGSPHDQVS